MEKKTAYLISCSDHYGHRMHVLDSYLKEHGYETTYITSDFDHTSKAVFECKVPGCVQLSVRPYKRNLSLARILSHWEFARAVFRYLEELPQEPSLVAVLIPPNFLAHYLGKYRKKHPNVRLIFDIFDLWPETFPSGKMKKLLAPAFAVWAWIRDHSLSAADVITTECDLFREKLKLPEDRAATVYLCADTLKIEKSPVVLSEEALDLCYLGAINNIISIPDICGLIAELVKTKPVNLHIIGKGERQQEFIDAAKAAGANVVFYGPIYDDVEKQKIMSRCHFGLNMMKSSVCVGLTMKSVDYFRFGLPIINNIPADTRNFVVKNRVGVQFADGCEREILTMTAADNQEMREKVEVLFKTYFRTETVFDQLDNVLGRILET